MKQFKNISLLQMTSTLSERDMPFILQPIARPLHKEIFAYEVLYRGIHPAVWQEIDCRMLRFLSLHQVTVPLFVNLSNEAIITLDEQSLFDAHAKNDIFFEWSEQLTDEADFKAIAQKINAWTNQGLRFVIDDFGAGRDGFERLFAVDHITAIKFDGGLFKATTKNEMAKKMVEHLVKECANKGILTIGECIETSDEYAFATNFNFDFVQGFYVDNLPAVEVAAHHSFDYFQV